MTDKPVRHADMTPMQRLIYNSLWEAWKAHAERCEAVNRTLHRLTAARAERDGRLAYIHELEDIAAKNGMVANAAWLAAQWNRPEHPDDGRGPVAE